MRVASGQRPVRLVAAAGRLPGAYAARLMLYSPRGRRVPGGQRV